MGEPVCPSSCGNTHLPRSLCLFGLLKTPSFSHWNSALIMFSSASSSLLKMSVLEWFPKIHHRCLISPTRSFEVPLKSQLVKINSDETRINMWLGRGSAPNQISRSSIQATSFRSHSGADAYPGRHGVWPKGVSGPLIPVPSIAEI